MATSEQHSRSDASSIGKLAFISASAPIEKNSAVPHGGFPLVYAQEDGTSDIAEEDGRTVVYVPEFPPALPSSQPLSEFSRVLTTGHHPVPTAETIIRILYSNGFKLESPCDSYIFRGVDSVGNKVCFRVFYQKGISGEGGKTENVLRVTMPPKAQKPRCPADLEAKLWKEVETRLRG